MTRSGDSNLESQTIDSGNEDSLEHQAPLWQDKNVLQELINKKNDNSANG